MAKRKAGPAGKRITDEARDWAAVEFPIEMLMDLIALQRVVMARRPLGTETRWLKRRIVESLDAVPSPEALRARFTDDKLAAIQANLRATTKANAEDLARGFGDRIRKDYLNQRIEHAAGVLPTMVRDPGPPPSSTEEWLAREEAEAERVRAAVAASGAEPVTDEEGALGCSPTWTGRGRPCIRPSGRSSSVRQLPGR
jgi:hypothetical protein